VHLDAGEEVCAQLGQVDHVGQVDRHLGIVGFDEGYLNGPFAGGADALVCGLYGLIRVRILRILSEESSVSAHVMAGTGVEEPAFWPVSGIRGGSKRRQEGHRLASFFLRWSSRGPFQSQFWVELPAVRLVVTVGIAVLAMPFPPFSSRVHVFASIFTVSPFSPFLRLELVAVKGDVLLAGFIAEIRLDS